MMVIDKMTYACHSLPRLARRVFGSGRGNCRVRLSPRETPQISSRR